MTSNIYLDFIRRWFWLLAIGVGIAIVATNLALSQRIPLYQSTATVQVGRTVRDSSPDEGSLAISSQLVPIYTEIAKRDPVLDAVAEALDLPFSADYLRSRLLVSPVRGTQLIDIMVVDADPALAAALANEISRQLVLQSPSDQKEDETQQFVENLLIDLQTKITGGQDEIAELESKIGETSSAIDVSDLRVRLEALHAQVDTWQQSYATLISSSEPSKTNYVEVVSNALPATTPLAAPTSLYYGLGIVVGGGTAAAVALGLSTLFGAVRRVDDLRRIASSVPVTTIPYLRDIRRRPLVSSSAPTSPPAASYRILRNILQTRQSDAGSVSIAVISSRPGEGKTTTIANLAIVLASIQRSVILVDANVRNPSLDLIFGTDTSRGMSDVVLGDCQLADALQPTAYPNLTILGAGSIPGSYTDILSPGRVRLVVDAVSTLAEIILIDTPSIQEEQEALMLAREADAAIVVVEAGRIRAPEVERMLETLRRSDIDVVSIALNKARAPRGLLERLPFSRDARLRKIAASRRLARRQPAALVPDRDHQSAPKLERLNTPERRTAQHGPPHGSAKGTVKNAQSAPHSNRSESA